MLTLCFAALFAAFIALGVWQVHRRAWKLALIARVDSRIHAAPVPAPPPAQWPDITRKSAEYRHVSVTGQYRHDVTLVHATTDLGYGYWALSPLKTLRGFTVLVNRGFVPADSANHISSAMPPDGTVHITGLLRITEPKGTLLRSNRPAQNQWYSRDVPAIAEAHHLGRIAPYFIDSDKRTSGTDPAVGGLTVVHFRNEHLSYAITWFALAFLTLFGAGILFRHEWRVRRETEQGGGDQPAKR
ncbi:SURF1 family protein [Stakelama sediminis]